MDVINRLPKLIGIVILTGLLLSIVLGFMADQVESLAPNIQFGDQSDSQATFFPKGNEWGGIQTNLNYNIHNDFMGGDEIKITVSIENRMNETADLRVALHDSDNDIESMWPSPDFRWTGPGDAPGDFQGYIEDGVFPFVGFTYTIGPDGYLVPTTTHPALNPNNYETEYHWKNMLVGEQWKITRNTDWESTNRERFEDGFNVTFYHEQVGYIGNISIPGDEIKDTRGCWVCVNY